MQGIPPCVTLNVLPATVNAPDRAPADGFASAVNPTSPDPDTVAPLVIWSHAALLAAVYVHPGAVITRARPVPPKPFTEAALDCRSYPHTRPPCEIVTFWPAIEIVPKRPFGLAFGPTEKLKAPDPVPEAALVIPRKLALLEATHPQVPADAVIVIDPLPPLLPITGLL